MSKILENLPINQGIQEPKEINQRYNVSYRGNDYERAPKKDRFETNNKKGKKTAAIIAAVTSAIISGFIIFLAIKGHKAIPEGEEKGLFKSIKKGFEELRGKSKPQKENKTKNPKETPDSKTKTENENNPNKPAINNEANQTEKNTSTSELNIENLTPVQKRALEFARNEYSIFSPGKDYGQFGCNPEDIYRNAINLKYENIRGSHYVINERYNQNIGEITSDATATTLVRNENNWNYRFPKSGTTKKKSIDRISLNVYPEEELITKLDKYFATSKIQGYYKTPEDLMSWSLRHDPITIYLQEPINDKIVEDIVQISKPHIRSTENVLIGKTVSPGVAVDKSPSEQDLIELIEQAKKYDEILANYLKEWYFVPGVIRKSNKLKASAGQVAAVKALLDDLSKAG